MELYLKADNRDILKTEKDLRFLVLSSQQGEECFSDAFCRLYTTNRIQAVLASQEAKRVPSYKELMEMNPKCIGSGEALQEYLELSNQVQQGFREAVKMSAEL